MAKGAEKCSPCMLSIHVVLNTESDIVENRPVSSEGMYKLYAFTDCIFVFYSVEKMLIYVIYFCTFLFQLSTVEEQTYLQRVFQLNYKFLTATMQSLLWWKICQWCHKVCILTVFIYWFYYEVSFSKKIYHTM